MEIERIDTRPKDPLGLYLVTLAIEVIVGYPRAALLAIFFAFIGIISDLDKLVSFAFLQGGDLFAGVGQLAILGFILGYANVIASIVAFLGYGSGSLQTRLALGARKLSLREAQIITAALERIQLGANRRVTSFTKLYVVDSVLEYAFLVGTTLYVSSAAVRGSHLPEILAHELGHMQNKDGSVILALRRLVYPPFSLFIGDVHDFSTRRPAKRAEPLGVDPLGTSYQALGVSLKHTLAEEWEPMKLYYSIIMRVLYFVFAVIGGGIGVWITSWFWAGYFRQRDYFADDFAVGVGLKGELLAYLEQNLFYSTSVPYMLGWQPAHELRIDRIHRQDASEWDQAADDAADDFQVYTEADLNAHTADWIVAKMEELGYNVPVGGVKAHKTHLVNAFLADQKHAVLKKNF